MQRLCDVISGFWFHSSVYGSVYFTELPVCVDSKKWFLPGLANKTYIGLAYMWLTAYQVFI